ncbi:MAG: hypothetical protein K0R71_617 [Bacillales bacterium]|jgi:uncharacterized protein YabE (DUF348 family)|nr:hypothetical protein [Bacillales bacterium]
MFKKLKDLSKISRRKPNYTQIITGSVLFVFVTSIVMYYTTMVAVAVSIDGKSQTVNTHANTAEELLKDLNVKVGKYDYLNVSLNQKIKDDLTIHWVPAQKVTIELDGVKQTKWTTKKTVGEFVQSEGIVLKSEDTITPESTKKISNNMVVSIGIAFPVTINDGGTPKKIMSTKKTVGEILEQNEIVVEEPNRVTPAKTEIITGETVIDIVRVTKESIVEDQAVSFKTVKQNDGTLYVGSKKIKTKGQKGTIQKTFEVTKENGAVVSKVELSSVVVKEPIDQIELIGTKAYSASGKYSIAPFEGGRTLTVKATAYTIESSTGRTSTGINLRENIDAKIIAVDPNVIPIGSRVYVEGYGYAVAADQIGHKGNYIDLFMASNTAARNWGSRTVTIRIQ